MTGDLSTIPNSCWNCRALVDKNLPTLCGGAVVEVMYSSDPSYQGGRMLSFPSPGCVGVWVLQKKKMQIRK